MHTSTGFVLLIVVAVVVCLLIIYSGVPNLWVRMFHRIAIRDIPNDTDHGSNPKRVVLTFDDGPDAKYTPQLLDALKQAGIHATFFVIAEKAIQHPQIMERMIAEGHQIEIHGYRHLMVPFLLPNQTIKQVAESSAVLKTRYGIDTTWYRPTWGLCNAVTLLSQACKTHSLVTWSIMVGDWKCTPAKALLARIADKLHPGAIIVLHDSDETFGAEDGAPTTVIELIPMLKQRIEAENYTFVTLGEAMP